MSSLPDKLRAKLARPKLHESCLPGEVNGQVNEHARLTEIHGALVECFEALERARAQWMHSVNEKACKQALARLAKVLEE